MRWVLSLSLVLIGLAAAPAHAEELVTVMSVHSVDETVKLLTEAVEANGAKVFAVVDHAAGADAVGTDLPPTKLVIFGNPALGTPLIAQERTSGLDLPIRMLVWQDDETVQLSYLDAAALARRYGLDEDSEPVTRISGALEGLAAKASR